MKIKEPEIHACMSCGTLHTFCVAPPEPGEIKFPLPKCDNCGGKYKPLPKNILYDDDPKKVNIGPDRLDSNIHLLGSNNRTS